MTMTDTGPRTNGRTPPRGAAPDDAIEMLNSGKVVATIDGTTHTLRRPKFGELRDLREQLAEMGRTQSQRNDDAAANDQLRELHDDADLFFGWFRHAFELLSDNTLPDDDDDMPAWFVRADLPGHLIQHWRSVPTVPGSR